MIHYDEILCTESRDMLKWRDQNLILKIQDGGRPPYWKTSFFGNNSAADCPIVVKFCMTMRVRSFDKTPTIGRRRPSFVVRHVVVCCPCGVLRVSGTKLILHESPDLFSADMQTNGRPISPSAGGLAKSTAAKPKFFRLFRRLTGILTLSIFFIFRQRKEITPNRRPHIKELRSSVIIFYVSLKFSLYLSSLGSCLCLSLYIPLQRKEIQHELYLSVINLMNKWPVASDKFHQFHTSSKVTN